MEKLYSLLGGKKKGTASKKPVGAPLGTKPTKPADKKTGKGFGEKLGKGFSKWTADKDKRTKLTD
jgi:hypothetical protein